MSAFQRIALAGSLDGTYADARTLVESVLGAIKIRARQDGWIGTKIFDADWIEQEGQPATVVISLEGGDGDVTVDQVRAFIKDKRAKTREKARAA